jgi:uncharacterized protein (TIGR02757 family)
MNVQRLKPALERLYRSYDVRHLSTDPLKVVHSFTKPQDLEVAGLITSVFSYGRVDQILKTVERILEPMGGAPHAFILDFDPHRDARHFSGIVHRFNKGADIISLLLAIRQALRNNGSLQELFLEGYTPAQPDVGEALSLFVERILDYSASAASERQSVPPGTGFRFLFPSPRNKSACKRLNMYLRWMVRCGDGLDLGIWEGVSPAKLVVPLDTHVCRISRRLGLTDRSAADWKTAIDVTRHLRCLDRDDPVKYDFSLARLGIMGRCLKEMDSDKCRGCGLYGLCRVPARKMARTG